MPSELLAFIQQRQPRYKKQYSRTAQMSYYANTCQRGALFGDHYLVSEPGGAFFPEDCADAARIEISRAPCSPPLLFQWTKRRCAPMLALKSFRIGKRQFSFGRGGPRRFRSLKHLWAYALACHDAATDRGKMTVATLNRHCTRTD
jgi:hypothetical protein